MKRRLAGILLVVIVSSCGTPQAGASPQPTPNINRSRIDLAYTVLASSDLHRVPSRTLLTAALTAVRLQATSTGGSVDAATPEFSDVSDQSLADFKLFAQVIETIALRNPQLSADLISDSAIDAMVRATPDCHTFYRRTTNDAPAAVGLQSQLLAGNVGYVAWHAFVRDSSYDTGVEVRKALDALLAKGARAWLFDWRDSPGGTMLPIADWFLNGEPLYLRVSRAGAPSTTNAQPAFRLPAAYQLPIVILMNRRSVGNSEIIAMSLRESRRATIVGSKTPGCVGNTNVVNLPGGGAVAVAAEEFVGAVTGTHYANVGIDPDIVSDDATAIETATKLLQSKIAP